MASRQNLIPNCELFQPSHTHTQESSAAVQLFQGFLSVRNCWVGRVSEFWNLTSLVLQAVFWLAFCIQNVANENKLLSNPVHISPMQNQLNMQTWLNMQKSLCFYINAVLWQQLSLTSLLCFAYASVSRTSKKNCASHDCSASHHCRLVSSLFEIRHAKHLWFTHAQKKLSFTHHTSPF